MSFIRNLKCKRNHLLLTTLHKRKVVKDLAFFINQQFYLLYGDTWNKEQKDQKLIRSEESFRVD